MHLRTSLHFPTYRRFLTTFENTTQEKMLKTSNLLSCLPMFSNLFNKRTFSHRSVILYICQDVWYKQYFIYSLIYIFNLLQFISNTNINRIEQKELSLLRKRSLCVLPIYKYFFQKHN